MKSSGKVGQNAEHDRIRTRARDCEHSGAGQHVGDGQVWGLFRHVARPLLSDRYHPPTGAQVLCQPEMPPTMHQMLHVA